MSDTHYGDPKENIGKGHSTSLHELSLSRLTKGKGSILFSATVQQI